MTDTVDCSTVLPKTTGSLRDHLLLIAFLDSDQDCLFSSVLKKYGQKCTTHKLVSLAFVFVFVFNVCITSF